MKEDKYIETLAKNQVCAIFLMRDIRENVLPKFTKPCMEVGVPLRGTNMGAGNQQKHLCLSFLQKRDHLKNS